jgi:hypothetical protein
LDRSVPTDPIRIDVLTQPTARLSDCDTLYLNLPDGVAETADDQGAGRLISSQHCFPPGAPRRCREGCADRGDRCEILDLHASSPESILQVPPRQCALRLGVLWEAAVGGRFRSARLLRYVEPHFSDEHRHYHSHR